VAPTKKKTALSRLRWWLLWSVPLLWCLASQAGWLTFFENKALDWRFRFRGEADAPVKVIYVDIDSQSLAEIGGFPWSRSYFARVCSALIERAGVRAVGIDVVFSENGVAEAIDWRKRVDGNREFARYLAPTPPVVLAASYGAAIDRDINGRLVFRQLPRVDRLAAGEAGEPPETPAFRLSERDGARLWSPAIVGLIDTRDGGTRSVPAYAPTAVRTYLHLSIELARLHYGVPADGVKIADDHIDLVRADGTSAARIPLRERQFLDVNWFSAWTSPARNPRVGFSTVFAYADMLASGKPEERAAAETFFAQPDFKEAIVLIGPVDPLLQDLATTPFDDLVPVPKVSIHGNLLKTIVSEKYLRPLPEWRGVAWAGHAVTLALTLLVAALATAGGARGTLAKLGAVAALGGYVALVFGCFRAGQIVLPVAAPLGAAFTASFLGVIVRLIEEQKQKGRIKGLFGTYLAPSVVDAMIESGRDPELGGHDAEITAYFSDIQSFSAFSEVMSSAQLTELLNEYLTACTDIVQAEGGSLDKYIGDAVVAMYGAPIELADHAYRACVASQLVQRRIAELREKWRGEGGRWPAPVHGLRTRIGLNTGECMIGNMGSRTRFNYTMMGDNVNLAARMESGAKSWGVYTLCTEATRRACERHGDRVVFRPLGRIVVKGRTQPVPIHEIVGLKEDVTPRTHECLGLFADALERYYARDWTRAEELFAQSGELEPNLPGQTPGVTDNPSRVYLRIIAHHRAEPPPAEWDGVFVMQGK
jgi:adenylate cyclase